MPLVVIKLDVPDVLFKQLVHPDEINTQHGNAAFNVRVDNEMRLRYLYTSLAEARIQNFSNELFEDRKKDIAVDNSEHREKLIQRFENETNNQTIDS